VINLFEFDNHTIDTSEFDHLLHGQIVKDFEQEICEYVGAKYAASFFSASYALYAIMKSSVCITPDNITIPSMIPPVVPNVLVDAGVNIEFNSNTDYVMELLTLHSNLIEINIGIICGIIGLEMVLWYFLFIQQNLSRLWMVVLLFLMTRKKLKISKV